MLTTAPSTHPTDIRTRGRQWTSLRTGHPTIRRLGPRSTTAYASLITKRNSKRPRSTARRRYRLWLEMIRRSSGRRNGGTIQGICSTCSPTLPIGPSILPTITSCTGWPKIPTRRGRSLRSSWDVAGDQSGRHPPKGGSHRPSCFGCPTRSGWVTPTPPTISSVRICRTGTTVSLAAGRRADATRIRPSICSMRCPSSSPGTGDFTSSSLSDRRAYTADSG
mmetsp:Transcript_24933/g.54372  ORF Transcript_24933/g.54372 Transcript_24933/m.54372 type:complete len:221 (+) Transcript_24933:1348-2010(+)